jgi:cytochrome c553
MCWRFPILRCTDLSALAYAAALLALGQAQAQTPPDALSAGREKFVQCASCHGADGRSAVMAEYPKIGGQNAGYTMNALKAYRSGRRQGTYAAIMSEVAKPLTDLDIANLAAYVESLGPP